MNVQEAKQFFSQYEGYAEVEHLLNFWSNQNAPFQQAALYIPDKFLMWATKVLNIPCEWDQYRHDYAKAEAALADMTLTARVMAYGEVRRSLVNAILSEMDRRPEGNSEETH